MHTLPELRRLTVDRLLVCLLFVGIAVIACLMPAQNDTWWHLRAGYDMLRSHTILLSDTFSHTVFGQPWPNYEWLTEVVFAALHGAGGMPLLTACCAAAIVAGLAFTFAAMRGDTVERVLLLSAVVAGSTITWSLRPQAFTLLLLGATIHLTAQRRWWPLPPLFLVWANLHGAVALGGLVLTGTALGHAWHYRRLPRGLVLIAALCAACTMLTPLGVHYWPEIAASIRRSRINDIAEWRPPALPPNHLVFWVMASVLVGLAWFRRRQLHDAGAKGLLCSALLALALALRSMRNISPFLMIAAPAISCLIARPAGAPRRRSPQMSNRRAVLHLAVIIAAVVAAVTVVAHTWSQPPARLGWQPVSTDAARAISACRGPIYNRYVDGGPLTFFAPRQRVLLDSRQDPYPVALVQKQFEVERGGDYHRLFDEYGIRCAVLPPDSPTRASLIRGGWSVVFADDRWAVLEEPLGP